MIRAADCSGGVPSARRSIGCWLDCARAEARCSSLRGEAGVGKTALLEYLVDEASGCRIVRAAGAEAEMELAYAGLQQLCAPMLDHLDALPGPQREALSTAFGLSAGDPPDRFFVGLAVLSLCAEAARDRPLLCVVDDAQWLDRASAQALAFVARRLHAESVALVLAIREIGDESELPGLPDMTVRGLTDADARALLESAIHVHLDERVRSRIVAETRGNPLALLELPRAMTPAELAGGYGVPEAMPMASRIEQGFRRRLESLPPQTRQLLLTAAAEPVGDATLVWRAAERLGIGVEAAAAASAAGLLEIDGRVRFRHPLVRSAAYRASAPPERQEVHRALADVTDPDRDPDRRAWHRAHATDRPDEDVAAELERSASRAAARGGIAAAAAFLERAAELTPDPASRGARALAAAQAKFESAAPDAALELLALAELCPLEELERARLERLRAEIVFARTRGRDAPALLLDAARRLDPLDAAMARETYLEAMAAAMFAGRLGDGPSVREAAEAARAGPAAPQPPRADRPAPRRPGDEVRRGLRGRRAAAAEGARGVPGRERIDGTRPALVLAGVPPGPGSLGRRALVRARDARGARRARDGHAPRAPERGHASRGPLRARGSLRRRLVADRGGRRDHAGDRDGAAEVRGVHVGRVARPRGRRPRHDRGRQDRGDGQGRGHGAERQRLDHGRCSSTVSAATRTRTPQPSGRARTTSSRTPRGPWRS